MSFILHAKCNPQLLVFFRLVLQLISGLTDDYAVTARPFNCNVGLYFPARGKNELEKKINIAGASHKKKIIVGKSKTRLHCRG
jgi:hypothetical protein